MPVNNRWSFFMDVLYIVIPAYNEEEVLGETASRLKKKVIELVQSSNIDAKSKILFVDDGSSDRTWQMINQLHEEDDMFSGLRLSRNRGHQYALLAGLMYAKDCADVVISMDADLQDDIEAIDKMIEEYKKGSEVVYGVRDNRDTDSFAKRFLAEFFYKFVQALGTDVIFNHADYRLLSRKALGSLAEFTETNLFLRGLVPMLGYKTSVVTYARERRYAGEVKYTLKKSLALAIEGLTSTTTKPLKFITLTGAASFLVSVGMVIYSFISHFTRATVPGWSSLIISLWFIGGLILFSIGIVGEYVGKIYLETKRRPRYIIDKVLDK